MTVEQRIASARDLTPAEAQAARVIAGLGREVAGLTLAEVARAAHASVATVRRLCAKLGYRGFRDLKVAAVQQVLPREPTTDIDVNFPFRAGDDAETVLGNMSALYETTVRDTAQLIDPAALERAARLIDRAESVEIYTGSHNIYPAQMFEERLLSAGKRATCPVGSERSYRLALASDERHCAVLVTYSALAPAYREIAARLAERNTPVILVGSRRARATLPGLDAYLMVSERESLQNRITQFASHIAVQFVLDALFCRVFARNYDRSMAFLKQSLPYTRLHSAL